MTQEKIGVESQRVSTKTVTLALAAVFLTYFLSSLMILGLSIASPMIAADLNGMDLFSSAISLPALANAPSSPMYGIAHESASLVIL